MKSPALVLSLLLLAPLAWSQAMMKAAPAPATGTGSMSASPRTGTQLRLDPGTGGKVQFSDLAAAQALAAKGPTVLFFAADWCPTCKEALRDLNARGGELAGLTVVVVNYDDSSALKARYGVSYQHTWVQIDGAGKVLATWNGGAVRELLARVVRPRT